MRVLGFTALSVYDFEAAESSKDHSARLKASRLVSSGKIKSFICDRPHPGQFL